VEFCVDSTYAINTALGRWHSARGKNAELARRLRSAYSALAAHRGHANVRITHVRAHAREPGNETADALAKLGAKEYRATRCTSPDPFMHEKSVGLRPMHEIGTIQPLQQRRRAPQTSTPRSSRIVWG
jgi:hypothetical protein